MSKAVKVPEQPQRTRIWTVTDVANLFQVSESYVYELVKRNEIPHGKIGRLVRFDPSDIEAWWKIRKA